MFQGLSTNQAPPISVPFRFFITAPFFAILIAFIFMSYPSDIIFDRYSNVAVATTHLFTLGILAMSMFGALQQMLPVLAGAVIKKPLLIANIVHINLTLGTLALSGGFLYSIDILLQIGSVMLSLAFGVFLFTITKLLFKVKYITPTVKAMKIFSISGIITAMLGLFLLSSHIAQNITILHINLVNVHILFGLFGFALILIMGVSFQVIPMFYVARDFPKVIQNRSALTIFGMLIIGGIFSLLKLDITPILYILSGLAIIFAYFGLNSLNNRRRSVFDVTLWYWKLSFYTLIIAMCLLIYGVEDKLLIILLVFGFLYPLLQGMIYKIIPFLSWFHLNSKGLWDIPTLRGFIIECDIKIQFFIYLASVIFFLLSIIFNDLFLYIGSMLFIVANVLYIVNMLKAIRIYKNKIKYFQKKEIDLENEAIHL